MALKIQNSLLRSIRVYDVEEPVEVGYQTDYSATKYTEEIEALAPNESITIFHNTDTSFNRDASISQYGTVVGGSGNVITDNSTAGNFDLQSNNFLRFLNGKIQLATTYSDGADSVFEFADDFADGTIDTNKWTSNRLDLGTITEANSEIQIVKTVGSGPLHLISNQSFPTNTIIEARLNVVNNITQFLSMNNGGGGIDFHVGNFQSANRYMYMGGDAGLGEVYHDSNTTNGNMIAKIRRVGNTATLSIYTEDYSSLINSYTYSHASFLNPSKFNLQVNYSSNGTTTGRFQWAKVRKTTTNTPTSSIDINANTMTITNNESFALNGFQCSVDITQLGDLTNKVLIIKDSNGDDVPYVYNNWTSADNSKFYSNTNSIIMLKTDLTASEVKVLDYQVLDIPYNQYQTFTTTNLNHVDTTSMAQINSLSVNITLPTNTLSMYAISFDGKTTWKAWNGSSFVDLATQDLSNIGTEGMTLSTLQGLTTANLQPYVDSNSTIDFAVGLSTSDRTAIPEFESISVNYNTQNSIWKPIKGTELEDNFSIKMYNDNTVIKNIGTNTYKIKANIMV